MINLTKGMSAQLSLSIEWLDCSQQHTFNQDNLTCTIVTIPSDHAVVVELKCGPHNFILLIYLRESNMQFNWSMDNTMHVQFRNVRKLMYCFGYCGNNHEHGYLLYSNCLNLVAKTSWLHSYMHRQCQLTDSQYMCLWEKLMQFESQQSVLVCVLYACLNACWKTASCHEDYN